MFDVVRVREVEEGGWEWVVFCEFGFDGEEENGVRFRGPGPRRERVVWDVEEGKDGIGPRME